MTPNAPPKPMASTPPTSASSSMPSPSSTIDLTCPRCGAAVAGSMAAFQTGGRAQATCGQCRQSVTFADTLGDPEDAGVRTNGRDLVMDDGEESPPRCVKCNAPAQKRW